MASYDLSTDDWCEKFYDHDDYSQNSQMIEECFDRILAIIADMKRIISEM